LLRENGLRIKEVGASKKIFYNESTNDILVADDNAVKKIKTNGKYDSFEHISEVAYDIASLKGSDYFYFSDGTGVVKMTKDKLEAVSWSFTTNIASNEGWAIGLDVAKNSDGETIAVFNGTSILVFDEKMELLDSYVAREEERGPTEALFLSADKYRATPNSDIAVRGGGFDLKEPIRITLAGSVFYSETGENGRFIKIISIPSVFPTRTDLRVVGLNSGLTYSFAFEIE